MDERVEINFTNKNAPPSFNTRRNQLPEQERPAVEINFMNKNVTNKNATQSHPPRTRTPCYARSPRMIVSRKQPETTAPGPPPARTLLNQHHRHPARPPGLLGFLHDQNHVR